MHWLRIGWVLGLLFSCGFAHADPLTYECNVLSEQGLTDDGGLGAGLDLYIGKSFHVERSTGTILGGGLGNSAYPTKSVIDPGSEDSSFKLVWISAKVLGTEGTHNAYYLEIKEWADGLFKPFVLVGSGTVLTGTCR